MSLEKSSGLGVHNHYGPRKANGSRGDAKSDSSRREVIINCSAGEIGSDLFLAPTIPAGVRITGCYVKVYDVFDLGGTTPKIEIGTYGSEATDGFSLSEAQAEAVGIHDIGATRKGTWNSMLTADTKVGVALSGTTPTIGPNGRFQAIIYYANFYD